MSNRLAFKRTNPLSFALPISTPDCIFIQNNIFRIVDFQETAEVTKEVKRNLRVPGRTSKLDIRKRIKRGWNSISKRYDKIDLSSDLESFQQLSRRQPCWNSKNDIIFLYVHRKARKYTIYISTL